MGQKVEKLVELPEHEIEHLKAQARNLSAAGLNQIFDLFFRQEASMRFAAQPKLVLEMIFVQLVQFQPALPIDDLIHKLDHLRREISGNQPTGDLPGSSVTRPDVLQKTSRHQRDSSQQHRPANAQQDSGESAEKPEVELRNDLSDPDAVWNSIYDQISQENPSLAANLSKCSLKGIFEDRLEIEVIGNGFTLNMIQRKRNMALLKKVFADHFGKAKQIVLNTKFDPNQESQKKKDKNNKLKQEALHHPLVADAIEIFNGKLIDIKVGD